MTASLTDKKTSKMKKYFAILLVIGLSLTGCKDFLDKNPDMRATIDSKEKVQLLLVSAYSTANYGMICELSSDNMIDNNTPDERGLIHNEESFDRADEECFSWEPIVSSQAQDSPYALWNDHYLAIAAANNALVAIDELESKGENMDAEKAEALLCRAYHHFALALVFCKAYRNDELSQQDLGLFYMDHPETVVKANYNRGTLTQLYDNIQADLEQALPLVSDKYYSVPKYHFNEKAAYAFAARFYLYRRKWDKVLQYANRVLGEDPATTATLLVDADYILNTSSDIESELNYWIDASQNSNLLILPVMSYGTLRFSSYLRYGWNRDVRSCMVSNGGPCWSKEFPGFHIWQVKNGTFGSLISKCYSKWNITDKVAGIGYMYNFRREFTTNETLLCRAEAKVFLNDLEGATSDLNLWAQSYDGGKGEMTVLTSAKIRNYFYDGRNTNVCPILHSTDMSPDFIVSADQLPFIRCILHFRRIETVHDGLRWFDLKRYGIEIKHYLGNETSMPIEKFLKWDDDRRAIQLPQEVIVSNSGIDPNPRVNVGDHAAVPYLAPMQRSTAEIVVAKSANAITRADK